MKPLIALVLVAAGSIVLGQDKAGSRKIVLPNPGLIRCDASHWWQGDTAEANVVYPLQVSVDHFDKGGCPLGLIAIYDKNVPFSDIQAELDRRYGKWSKSDSNKIRLYRVEPERFAIQLATIEAESRGTAGQKGMKQLIYISFAVSQRF